jgi:two-component system, NarL family, nitrate/nitrite response regulator NarL
MSQDPEVPKVPIRVLLVEDHEMVRTAFQMLIDRQGSMHVVGEAGTRREALALAGSENPDVILLDLDLGGESGLDFLPELRKLVPGARVLVLTGVADPEIHRKAIRLGAVGLVEKRGSSAVLLTAIEKVHAGEVWIDRTTTATVLAELIDGASRPNRHDLEAERMAHLSRREREIVALITEGLANKEIGRRLFISETTVRHHLTSIFAKLDLSNRLELSLYAYRHGLTPNVR